MLRKLKKIPGIVDGTSPKGRGFHSHFEYEKEADISFGCFPSVRGFIEFSNANTFLPAVL